MVDVKKHQTVNFTQSRSFGAISRRPNLSIASGRTDADTYFEKSYGNPFIASCFKRCVREHANQAGSLVAPGHLRFDFTHFGQVTSEELARMEAIVNEKIWEAIPVVTIETDIDTAKTWAQWRYLAKNMAKKSV